MCCKGINDLSKPEIIHEWVEPKEVNRFTSGLLIKMGRDFTPRVLIVVAVLLLLLYWFLHEILPDNEILPALDRGLLVAFVASIILCSLFFVRPLLGRCSQTKCKISDREVSKSDINGKEIILWKNVKGYCPSESYDFPNLTSILVYGRPRKMVLWVPRGELAEQVVTTFSERCPLIREDEDRQSEKVVLSDLEYLALLITSVGFAIVVGNLLFTYSSRPALIVLLLVTLVFGPGTMGCFLLHGKKILREKNLKGIAVLFNLLGFVLFMLAWALFALYHWSQVIKESG